MTPPLQRLRMRILSFGRRSRLCRHGSLAIRSRCQHFSFRAVKFEEIVGQLKDLVGYIRVYFGRAPAWHDVEDQLKKIRREKDR